MVFARRMFLVAGIYGLLIISPMYFVENLVGRLDPPAVAHPEYYYGFLGAALAWQLVYFAMGHDPLRYRPLIPLAIFAKLSFVLSVIMLFGLGRASGLVVVAVLGDAVFAVLFGYAFLVLGRCGSLD